MPCPGMTFTASVDIEVVLSISFGGVAAALPAGVFEAGVITSFGIVFPCSRSGLKHGSQHSILYSSLTYRIGCYAPPTFQVWGGPSRKDRCVLDTAMPH